MFYLGGHRLSSLARGSCSGIGDWRVRPTLFGGRWAQGHQREGGKRRGRGNNGQHGSNATLQLRSSIDRIGDPHPKRSLFDHNLPPSSHFCCSPPSPCSPPLSPPPH